MPKVKVDGIEIEVPQGATVLQACEVAGKEFPRFCRHARRLSRTALVALTITGLFPIAPANAAVKAADAWGQCLWEKVPTSAAHWLNMPMPKPPWRYPLLDFPPEFALQFRLRAACNDRLTPVGKRNPPYFDVKAVRKALEAQRPASIGADKVDPMAYRCDRYPPNDTAFKTPAESGWGFGLDTSKAQFYLETSNLVPKGGPESLSRQGWLTRCSFIQADGTFQDA